MRIDIYLVSALRVFPLYHQNKYLYCQCESECCVKFPFFIYFDSCIYVGRCTSHSRFMYRARHRRKRCGIVITQSCSIFWHDCVPYQAVVVRQYTISVVIWYSQIFLLYMCTIRLLFDLSGLFVHVLIMVLVVSCSSIIQLLSFLFIRADSHYFSICLCMVHTSAHTN